MRYADLGDGCQIKGDRLYLQNVGHVKVRWHRPIDGKVKTLSVTRKNGKWYVNFMVEREARPLPATGQKIALDVGSRSFCVDSEGRSCANPKHLKAAQDHLKRCQQRLARRKKGSQRREKARQLLAKAHEKVANQRRDFIHKLSHRYIQGYDTVYVEDLDILSMAKSAKGNTKYVYKSIADAGWGMFFNFLSYKAEDAGRAIVKVDPAGTSENCSNCGEPVPKKVTTRVHRCPVCGLKIGRDLNAAINILKIGSVGAFGPGREVCGATEKSA
jgi:putative transposase